MQPISNTYSWVEQIAGNYIHGWNKSWGIRMEPMSNTYAGVPLQVLLRNWGFSGIGGKTPREFLNGGGGRDGSKTQGWGTEASFMY